MTGTSHLIFGIGTGVVSTILFPSISFFHLPLIAFSSLLPDIDSSSSKIGKRAKWVGKLFSHRGFFHTPLFLLFFLFIPNRGIRYSFMVGVLSHLFLDLMNKGGIMLFWPISKKKHRIANLKCGTWIEGGVVAFLLALEVMGVIFCRQLTFAQIANIFIEFLKSLNFL